MKQREQDFKPVRKLLKKLTIFLTGCILFFSCENDIEKINSFSEEKISPVRVGYDVEVAYTDSGILKGKIITPESRVFNAKDGSYIEFPQGMKVIFFDEEGNQTSFITSKYAINYPNKQLWIAKNDVVAINEVEKKELYTEELYWYQKEGKIHSDVFSKIITPDGTFFGEKGFEANQDLSSWNLKKSKGDLNVKDEPDN